MLKPFSVFFLVLCILFLSVMPSRGQDEYEDDNNFKTANVIVINAIEAQLHTLHDAADEDWVVFYALTGESYAIKTFNLAPGVDTYIELYDTNGTTLLKNANTLGSHSAEDILDWDCGKTGVYFVKIKHAAPEFFQNEGGYDLVLYYTDIFDLSAYLTGTVQSTSGQSVQHAKLQASSNEMNGTGLSAPDGSFVLALKKGSYTIFVSADGYLTKTVTGVVVPGNSLAIRLTPINTAPVAVADNIWVAKGESVTGNVLLNDNDGDGGPLQAVLDSDVSHGTLFLNSDGTFTYHHNGDNSLSDSFTYHAIDGLSSSSTATVTIKIEQSTKACIGPIMLLLK